MQVRERHLNAPHTAIYVSSYYLLYMCPHTTYFICVLILPVLYVFSHAGARAPPHWLSICWKKARLLDVCPHTNYYVCLPAICYISLAEYLLEESQIALCVSSY